MGAWIETFAVSHLSRAVRVASFMGAWIETGTAGSEYSGSLSHPLWVRGLKPLIAVPLDFGNESHPLWVRGLKLLGLTTLTLRFMSHPLWVRGLKHEERLA